jgi:hypothetical protein
MRRSNDNIWCHQTPTTFKLPVSLEQSNHVRVTAFWGVRTSNNARVENLGRCVIFDKGRTVRYATIRGNRNEKKTMNEYESQNGRLDWKKQELGNQVNSDTPD